jgi:hypothetical protein
VDVNPDPLTVSWIIGPPAATVFGEMLVSVSGAGFTANGNVLDVWPLLNTLIETDAACATKLACTVVVNWVALGTLAGRALPFQRMFRFEPKPVPFTVSVNAADPAVTETGEIEVIAGGRVLIVNGSEAEFASLIDDTATCAVAADAIRFAGTAAVSCVAEPKVVLIDVPFQVMVARVVKPDPVTVMTNAGLPANALLGLILLRTSGAGLMIMLIALELRVPFRAETDPVPAVA